MLHAAFVRSDVARGTIASIDATEAAGARRRRRRLDRRRPQPARAGQLGRLQRSGRPAAVRPGDGRGRRALRRRADRPRRRHVALHRRGRLRARDGRHRPAAGRRRRRPGRWPTVRRSSTTSWTTNVMASSDTGADPAVEAAFAAAAHVVTRTYDQQRYLCVPMETRGIVTTLGRPQRAPRRAHLDAGPARRAQLPRPCPRRRREQRARRDGRRRRRLRPEDVHARPTRSRSSSPAASWTVR